MVKIAWGGTLMPLLVDRAIRRSLKRDAPEDDLVRPSWAIGMSDNVRYPIMDEKATFAHVLDRELRKNRVTDISLEQAIRVNRRTIGGWRGGRTFPLAGNFDRLLRVLKERGIDVKELERAHFEAVVTVEEVTSSEPEAVDEKAVEQIPAAYRFGIQDQKIDALPERLQVWLASFGETFSNSSTAQ